jgi:NAD+ synthase
MMSKKNNLLSIALAQTNPIVGDIEKNANIIRDIRTEAAKNESDIVVFSELNLSGYPPEDLVLRSAFLDSIEKTVNKLASETSDGGPAIILGAPWRNNGDCYNAALVLDNGKIETIRFKHHLPNYGVFDEERVFNKGPLSGPVSLRGARFAIMICEDMWFSDVSETALESGAEILIVINGSPFELNKSDSRLSHAVARVSETQKPLIYINQVGGQDDLVFDGGSFVLNSDCSLALQTSWWETKIIFSNWTKFQDKWVCDKGNIEKNNSKLESIYNAMVLGLKDYVSKNNFPGVVIGLSGGIDSALTAAVAVDALGSENVLCVMMPSPYTSKESLYDAKIFADNFNIKIENIDISGSFKTLKNSLSVLFKNKVEDLTEENMQSRIRGLILMSLSNKFGYMVLTTGNKSEVSVGYATLYGDMCGGYSVLKDIYKTTVTDLCLWRNKNKTFNSLGPNGDVIPNRIITKPPSAELRLNQKDEDSLPPYNILDAILKGLIEEQMSITSLQELGYDIEIVKFVWKLLRNSEYKRRQAAPGVKISNIAFGRDHRYPITQAYNGDIIKKI